VPGAGFEQYNGIQSNLQSLSVGRLRLVANCWSEFAANVPTAMGRQILRLEGRQDAPEALHAGTVNRSASAHKWQNKRKEGPVKSVTAIFACIMLGACASATQTRAPDGRVTHSLDCSGAGGDWMCQQQARVICGEKGYDIVSNSGDRGPIAAAGGGEFAVGTTISQSVVIACN
jgi:hypothetical protein